MKQRFAHAYFGPPSPYQAFLHARARGTSAGLSAPRAAGSGRAGAASDVDAAMAGLGAALSASGLSVQIDRCLTAAEGRAEGGKGWARHLRLCIAAAPPVRLSNAQPAPFWHTTCARSFGCAASPTRLNLSHTARARRRPRLAPFSYLAAGKRLAIKEANGQLLVRTGGGYEDLLAAVAKLPCK